MWSLRSNSIRSELLFNVTQKKAEKTKKFFLVLCFFLLPFVSLPEPFFVLLFFPWFFSFYVFSSFCCFFFYIWCSFDFSAPFLIVVPKQCYFVSLSDSFLSFFSYSFSTIRFSVFDLCFSSSCCFTFSFSFSFLSSLSYSFPSLFSFLFPFPSPAVVLLRLV